MPQSYDDDPFGSPIPDAPAGSDTDEMPWAGPETAPEQPSQPPASRRQADVRYCPKCNGQMALGRLHNKDQFGDPTYVWAPFGEPGFRKRGISLRRFGMVMLRCETCGFLEWYAPPNLLSRR